MPICADCRNEIKRFGYDGRCSSCQQKHHDKQIDEFLKYAASLEEIDLKRDKARLVIKAKSKLKALGVKNPSEIERDIDR